MLQSAGKWPLAEGWSEEQRLAPACSGIHSPTRGRGRDLVGLGAAPWASCPAGGWGCAGGQTGKQKLNEERGKARVWSRLWEGFAV